MFCGDRIMRAWKQDHDGFAEVPTDEVNSGSAHGHYWEKQLMRFHISPDGQRVLWNDLEGPHRGQLIVFGVRGSEADPILKVESTVLCS
jgi:hypothetical protein